VFKNMGGTWLKVAVKAKKIGQAIPGSVETMGTKNGTKSEANIQGKNRPNHLAWGTSGKESQSPGKGVLPVKNGFYWPVGKLYGLASPHEEKTS